MSIQMIIQEIIQQTAALNALEALEKLYKKQGKKRKHDEIDISDAANSAVNSVLTENCLNEIDVKDMIKEFGSTMFKHLYGELIFDTNNKQQKQNLLDNYLINNSVDCSNAKNIILFCDTSQYSNESTITKKLIIMCLNQLISNNELLLTKEQFNSIEMIIYYNEVLSKLHSEIYYEIRNYNITEKSLKIILNIINKYLSLIELEISPANLIDSTLLKCIPKTNFFNFLRKYKLKCIMSNCSDDANIDIKDIKQESFYSEQFVLINYNGKKVFSNAENKLNCIFTGIKFTITFGVFDSNVYPILYLKFDYNDNNDNEEYQDVIIKHKNLENKYHTSLLLESSNKPNISKILDGLLFCSKCKTNNYKQILETLKTQLDIKQELEKDEISDKKKKVNKKEIQFKIALYDLIKCIILWNNKTNKLSYKELFLNVIKLLFILKLIGDQCQVDLIKNITENPEFDKNNIVMFQTNDKILFEYSIKEGLNTIDKEYNILIKNHRNNN